jgi:23S rRNA (uracil1939-C5)-methyltransferase
MKKNDIFEIEIDDIDINGNGIGKNEGFCYFVEGALPGETIRARATKINNNYGFAKVDEILSTSPMRREPSCRYYKQCGGCTLQHLSYAAQLEWKTNYVQNCLKRIGGIDAPVYFTMPAKNEFRYRNKGAFPLGQGELLKIGFYSMRSHVLVDIDDCLIQNQDVKLLISQLKTWIVHNKLTIYDEKTGKGLLRHAVVRTAKNSDIMLILCINGKDMPYKNELIACFQYMLPRLKSIVLSVNRLKNNTILGDKIIPVYGSDTLTEQILGLDFKIGPHSFLQVNSAATETLYHTLFNLLNLDKQDIVADLYCGAGTITLPAAQRAKFVYGIEIVEEAVLNARDNAQINGIENVEFIAGDVRKKIAGVIETAGNLDAIILDPPRKGLEPEVIHACADAKAPKIGYVSCNPSTLARDLAEFAKLGYTVAAVQPVDMFPQTTHVETVVLMTRIALSI